MLMEGGELLDLRCSGVGEVVDAAGGLMLSHGAVKASYIDGIRGLLSELGPCMALTPGITLLHARPEKGALRNCLAFLRLAIPVPLGHETNDPVDLVLAFAANRRQSSHPDAP
jgi:mannitol/fructose-specific phosphotransferase system IIA component (Ntr-type)